MAVMESTLYLQNEELDFRNYPEVRTVLSDVQDLINYATEASIVISAYTSSTADRIDLSIVDLQKYTDLCRSVCSILGSASNVCYDLLVEMRTLQGTLQTLMYVKNRYGNQYIGTPTDPSASSDPNIL